MSQTPWNPVVLWSRPEAARAGTPLLVMFHGYLSNEQDLMGLAPLLPQEFTLASVRAPQPLGPGHTWFPLMHEPDFSVEKVTASVGDVWAWLDTVKGNHSSVTLLGFSMGMAVATSALRHRPAEVAAVVGLSGFVIPSGGNPFFDDEATKALRPPVFWGRGDADFVITPDKVAFTHQWLDGHASATKAEYPGMQHNINQEEMEDVRSFLREHVLGRAQVLDGAATPDS
ncbi:alpha/beta hydrolase [Zafaria cholistanensis]|nr:dienelactone hydrolase family protein [Zafaria cholistanensis]